MKFWPQCCVCEKDLNFAPPWDVPQWRTCDWCFRFWETLAAQNDIKHVYYANDYSPLDFYSQKAQNGDNYRNTFTAGQIVRETPRSLDVIFRVQNSPSVQDVGGFFYRSSKPLFNVMLAKRFMQHEFAILPEWNTMNNHIAFAIPPGVDMLRGIAAPQGHFQGGGLQIYIHPYVAQLLYPASCAFLANPNQNTYAQFLKDAKPAIEMQQCLNAEFKIHETIVNNDAHDHNVLKKLHDMANTIRQLEKKPEELAQEYLKLEQFVKKTKLKDPNKNENKSYNDGLTGTSKMGWKKMCEFVLEQRANLERDYSKMPYKSIENAAQCGDVRKNFKCGNMFSTLSPERQKLLLKMKILSGNNYTNTKEEIQCGTFLIHKTPFLKIEIIITFLGEQRQGNVIIYHYKVLTLITCYTC